jgi:tetrahydromethanopterin S-methyltransferase subunit G
MTPGRDFENGKRAATLENVMHDVEEIKTTLNAINARCLRQCGVLPYFRIALGALFSLVVGMYAWFIYHVSK